MSALDQKQTSATTRAMSALPPKADIHWHERDVCFVPLAEIAASMPRPLSKYGIEKDIERSDLAIADNDDIQSGVVRDVAFRA
jgi:hypothetical protein